MKLRLTTEKTPRRTRTFGFNGRPTKPSYFSGALKMASVFTRFPRADQHAELERNLPSLNFLFLMN